MYLQLDTKFNPFTYDELVRPLLHYKEAYDATEAAYSDLAMQTEAFKDMVNRENSPEAYEMFQRYSGDLNRVVDDFSKGMTASNRRALIGMKRRYASDISPIARASEAMNAANELRVKAGPDAIFEVGEYNSLDQFLHGKTANNRYQSREALTRKTAAMTEAAMAEALKDPEFQKAMGDQYWMITQHTGGSYAELVEAMKQGMADNPIAQNRFSEIRQRVLSQSGIENYDAAGQAAIMDAVNTGLYAGLDKPVRNFQANQDHMNPLQKAQINAANASAAHSRASADLARAQAANIRNGGGNRRGGSGNGTDRADRLQGIVKVRATNRGGGSGSYEIGSSWALESIPGAAVHKSYGELSTEQKAQVDAVIGNDSISGYNYYVVTEDAKGVGTGDDDFVIISPKRTVINGAGEEDEDLH